MVSSSPLVTGGQHVRAATRQQPAAQRPPHSARRSVEYRAVNPGPGGDAGITRRRAGGSRHKHRGWVRRGQAARIPTWNASPRVGVSTRQGGDVAQEISLSRASVRLATSHSNSIVHAIHGYPASSPGRPFVIKMYTSKKRGHVNAFASRLLRVDSETLLRDQECNATGTDRIAFRTTRRLEVAFR